MATKAKEVAPPPAETAPPPSVEPGSVLTHQDGRVLRVYGISEGRALVSVAPSADHWGALAEWEVSAVEAFAEASA